jgi:hypothetical protein
MDQMFLNDEYACAFFCAQQQNALLSLECAILFMLIFREEDIQKNKRLCAVIRELRAVAQVGF